MDLIVLFIKTIVCIFDIITLPIYATLQRPWNRISKIKAIRSKQIDPSDPYSPWVNVESPPKHFIDECLTLNELIQKSIQLYGSDKHCLGYREVIEEEVHYSEGQPITKYVLSDYKWITYGEFEQRVDNIRKGFLLKGVKSGDNVMIFAETSIDWFICAHSILRIGATVATLYSSANEEGIIHVMNETEVTHVLTSHHLLSKLIGLKNKIPKMSTIIYFNSNSKTMKTIIENTDQNSNLDLISLLDLEESVNLLSQELNYQAPKGDDIAFIIYTSGSTGVPKGVKFSHKNMLRGMSGYIPIFRNLNQKRKDVTYIAYLPLAHIFELFMEHVSLFNGWKIGYSSPKTLMDSGPFIRPGDIGDVTLLKPDLMAGVPMVLDRIRKGIYDKIDKKGLNARKVFDFVVDYKHFWSQRGFETTIINRIFCSKFRQSLGGNVLLMLVGGAPMSPNTQKLIKTCLNIKLVQLYSSTESISAGCAMDFEDESIGRVGGPLPGSQMKLIDWEDGGYKATDKPNPRGEIVIGGDSISQGYYKLDQLTKEAFYIDKDGIRWLITGDIGEVFPDGTFKIIDRKKCLIKLQNGKYVALGKIESELKCNEFVDNICVFGDLYDSYLVALIIPNQLSVISLAKSLKVDYNSVTDLYENQRIVEYITNQIRGQGMTAGLNKLEIPQNVILCSEEWTPDNGLLTAAMKIKRKNIIIKYQKQIDIIYKNNKFN